MRGGTLGILIPPSIMLIVYAAIAQVSPVRLYAAALFPGLMLASMYMMYVITRATINPSLAPKPKAEDVPPMGTIILELLKSFVPLFILIMGVLGSILAGIATPAEAAGSGLFGWPCVGRSVSIAYMGAFERSGLFDCTNLCHGLLVVRWFLDILLPCSHI